MFTFLAQNNYQNEDKVRFFKALESKVDYIKRRAVVYNILDHMRKENCLENFIPVDLNLLGWFYISRLLKVPKETRWTYLQNTVSWRHF